MRPARRPIEGTDPADVPAPFLRLPAVMRLTGLGRSTIYRMISEKRFPCPVRLARRAVAWRRADLEVWSDSRPMAAP
jgi:prophage regulatory protein